MTQTDAPDTIGRSPANVRAGYSPQPGTRTFPVCRLPGTWRSADRRLQEVFDALLRSMPPCSVVLRAGDDKACHLATLIFSRFVVVREDLLISWGDDEVAAVIGHEFGHLQLRHDADLQAVMSVAKHEVKAPGRWWRIESLVARQHENQADVFGWQLAVTAGFRPCLERLRMNLLRQGMLAGGSYSHPDWDQRLNNLRLSGYGACVAENIDLGKPLAQLA